MTARRLTTTCLFIGVGLVAAFGCLFPSRAHVRVVPQEDWPSVSARGCNQKCKITAVCMNHGDCTENETEQECLEDLVKIKISDLDSHECVSPSTKTCSAGGLKSCAWVCECYWHSGLCDVDNSSCSGQQGKTECSDW